MLIKSLSIIALFSAILSTTASAEIERSASFSVGHTKLSTEAGIGFDVNVIDKNGLLLGGGVGVTQGSGEHGGDVHLKLGYRPNDFGLYGIVGIGSISQSTDKVQNQTAAQAHIADAGGNTSYLYGGGIEYKFAKNYKLSAEYKNISLSSESAKTNEKMQNVSIAIHYVF